QGCHPLFDGPEIELQRGDGHGSNLRGAALVRLCSRVHNLVILTARFLGRNWKDHRRSSASSACATGRPILTRPSPFWLLANAQVMQYGRGEGRLSDQDDQPPHQRGKGMPHEPCPFCTLDAARVCLENSVTRPGTEIDPFFFPGPEVSPRI